MRLAWKRIAADYPDVESDFAGQPQKMLLNAAVLDEDKLQFDPFRLLLWPDRVGDNFIRPDDYDALLITACSFGPLAVMNFYRDMSFFGLKRKAQHVIPRPQRDGGHAYLPDLAPTQHQAGGGHPQSAAQRDGLWRK